MKSHFAPPTPPSTPILQCTADNGPSLDLAFTVNEHLGAALLAQAAPLTGDAAAEQRWISLMACWLAELSPELPAALQVSSFSLGLRLTDDHEMAGLNERWRGILGPTDVLAFPSQEGLPTLTHPVGTLELGDIIISLDTAARQAADVGQDLREELLFLASHGLLHLLGWDHPDDPGLEVMLAKQDRLVATTAVNCAYALVPPTE